MTVGFQSPRPTNSSKDVGLYSENRGRKRRDPVGVRYDSGGNSSSSSEAEDSGEATWPVRASRRTGVIGSDQWCVLVEEEAAGTTTGAGAGTGAGTGARSTACAAMVIYTATAHQW